MQRRGRSIAGRPSGGKRPGPARSTLAKNVCSRPSISRRSKSPIKSAIAYTLREHRSTGQIRIGHGSSAHLFASLAENEHVRIFSRIKEVLAANKVAGREARRANRMANQAQAKERAERLRRYTPNLLGLSDGMPPNSMLAGLQNAVSGMPSR